MKNERVLCVERALLQAAFPLAQGHWRVEAGALDALPYAFVPRPEAEQDFTRKQLIPYALLFDETGRVLTYRRQGSEGRLAGRFSAGIGGHINEGDAGKTLLARLGSGLRREMREETGITPGNVQLLGMINEDESEVGQCHIGIVFRVETAGRAPVFSDEIAAPEWRETGGLELGRFELWSALALRLLGEAST